MTSPESCLGYVGNAVEDGEEVGKTSSWRKVVRVTSPESCLGYVGNAVEDGEEVSKRVE